MSWAKSIPPCRGVVHPPQRAVHFFRQMTVERLLPVVRRFRCRWSPGRAAADAPRVRILTTDRVEYCSAPASGRLGFLLKRSRPELVGDADRRRRWVAGSVGHRRLIAEYASHPGPRFDDLTEREREVLLQVGVSPTTNWPELCPRTRSRPTSNGSSPGCRAGDRSRRWSWPTRAA